MRVVWSWLKTLVDLDGVDIDDLALRWTLGGMEVEAVEKIGEWWDRERIVTGAVTWVGPHPNADRLVLADVDWGAGAVHRVVTGAPNLLAYRETGTLAKPFKVVFAHEGAELYDGHAEGWVKMVLKGRPVRGVMSDAMVCSAKELGLSDDHDGIMILPEDTPVGVPVADILGDAVLEVDILPNFARALGMVGIARETAALLGRPFRAPDLPLLEGAGEDASALVRAGEDAAALVRVVIQDPDLCSRYTARAIRGVTLGASPDWMQHRLKLAGMRPINNVVDITNYVMLEWGEPLHAFDYDALVARAGGGLPTITVRRAAAGERMTTLDDVERVLDAETLLICDDGGPVAIAGVMGGAATEVRPATRNVLLEAAHFDYLNVRRTSRLQKLTSESAMRFGRGVHPALAEAGSRRAAELMRDLAGGTVVPGWVDQNPRPAETVTVDLDPAEIQRILGAPIPADDVETILRRLEFVIDPHPTRAGVWRVTVPPHRLDVAIPADLIEEVARIYGYDRLPLGDMGDPLPPQRENAVLVLDNAAKDALADAGLQEIIGYRLWSLEDEARLAADGQVDAAGYVALVNPSSAERSVLRRSLLVSLLDATTRNLRHTDRVALFEVGPVYHATTKAGNPAAMLSEDQSAGAVSELSTLPDEPRRVALVLTGPASPPHWRTGKAGRPLDFYDAKGAVETLCEALGIQPIFVHAKDLTESAPAADSPAPVHPSLHPGRTAAVYAAGGPPDKAGKVPLGAFLGQVGELHPLVLAAWDLGEGPVAVADLDLEAIGRARQAARTFVPFSAYPAVHRDLAVVVPESVAAADVGTLIRATGGAKLVDVVCFDVYRSEAIGEGRKSLAWSLTFQSTEDTLTGEAVDAMRGRIVRALEARLGAEVR